MKKGTTIKCFYCDSGGRCHHKDAAYGKIINKHGTKKCRKKRCVKWEV